MKKELTTKQDVNLAIKKSNSSLSITKKILLSSSSLKAKEIEEWISELWEWADINNIPENKIPQNMHKLLTLIEIDFSNMNLDIFPQQLCNLYNIK